MARTYYETLSYTRRVAVENKIKHLKQLKDIYTSYMRAEIQASPEWHGYKNLITQVNQDLKHAMSVFNPIREKGQESDYV